MDRNKLRDRFHQCVEELILTNKLLISQINKREEYIHWLETQLRAHTIIPDIELEEGLINNPFILRNYFIDKEHKNVFLDVMTDEGLIITFSNEYVEWLEENIIKIDKILDEIKNAFANHG